MIGVFSSPSPRRPRIDLRDYNPATADAAPAMTAWLGDAASYGYSAYLPGGSYTVAGSGAQLFLLTKAIVIEGDGKNRSIINVASSVGAGVDIFRYAPANSTEAFGFAMRGLAIRNVSGNPARHLINIDVTTSDALSFAAQLVIEDCWLGYPGWTPAGHTIHLENPTLKNPAFFTSSFRRNQIYGGLYLVGVSDSVDIDDNVITGAGGVEITQTAGAAKLTFTKNNVTCMGGFWLKASVGASVELNYFEAMTGASPTAGNGAYVDIDGATTPGFHRNQLSVLPGVALNGLRVGTSADAGIDGNSMYMADGISTGIIITSAAARPTYGNNRMTSGAGAAFTNSSLSLRIGTAPTRYANLADSTAITNTATETVFDKNLTIPGDTLRVGDVIRIRASGQVSTDAAGTVVTSIRARINGVAGNIFGAGSTTVAAGITDAFWAFEATAIVRTLGAGGTMRGQAHLWSMNAIIGATVLVGTGVLTIGTTTQNVVSLTGQFASARVGDSITVASVVIEVLPSGS